MSAIRAVIFDLFGTLVPEFPHARWDEHFARMAGALGVDRERLEEVWRATTIERQTGRLGDVRAMVVAICRRLGLEPEAERVEAAVTVRLDTYTGIFHAVEGAEETLRWLRERGYRIGLISMCAPETPALWRRLPIASLVDEAVFSSEVGLRKPDPAIYRLACERLQVRPVDALYVGDGSYGELTGAEAVGMRAVLIRDPAEVDGTIHRPEVERWVGASIGSLRDVPALLED
ncbi:MAG: HAD family hydrolase [Candidatus Velamenicoccus archaeovorus]